MNQNYLLKVHQSKYGKRMVPDHMLPMLFSEVSKLPDVFRPLLVYSAAHCRLWHRIRRAAAAALLDTITVTAVLTESCSPIHSEYVSTLNLNGQT